MVTARIYFITKILPIFDCWLWAGYFVPIGPVPCSYLPSGDRCGILQKMLFEKRLLPMSNSVDNIDRKMSEAEGKMEDKAGELILKVEHIICAGCAEDMENILRNKDGILDASVNYSDGTIRIRYEPGLIDKKRIFREVRKLGFRTKLIG
jgi:copper chaperone CopZ